MRRSAPRGIGGRGARWWWMVVAAAAVVGCASGAPTAESAAWPTPSSYPPLTGDGCGDDQPGRYLEELFEVAEVRTVTFTDSLEADIYLPAQDPASCAVGVIWVHGGGFTEAARNGPAEQRWGAALARRGYLLASIDYRLGQGEQFSLDQAVADPQLAAVVDDAVSDARTAIGWLRAHAAEWGVDPDRIAVAGTSAGAVTALGAALTAPADERPCAVVSVAGDLDPGWVPADPPPALLVHGDADALVPYQSSVDASAAIAAQGGTAELATMPGAGHEITGEPTPDLIGGVAGWLRAHVASGC